MSGRRSPRQTTTDRPGGSSVRKRTRTRKSASTSAARERPASPSASSESEFGTHRHARTLRVATLSEAFLTKGEERRRLGMPTEDDSPMPVVVEMNLAHAGGLTEAIELFLDIYRELFPDGRKPLLLADTYYRCSLSVIEVRELVRRDQRDTDMKRRSIYRVWPDFRMKALIDRSVSAVKADAA